MSICLLCQTEVQSDLAFHHVFLLTSPKDGVCESCLATFEQIGDPHCPTCFKAGVAEQCEDCLYWQVQGQEVHHVSLYRYNDAMKSYFSQYKFEGDYALRHLFAQDLKECLRQRFRNYQVIPIPLSEERLADRGFNQVTGWLESAGVTYCDLLGKKDIAKQSEKSREERRQLKQPFYIKDEQGLKDKIVLIDDIYTTGSTLQLAVQLLKNYRSKEVITLSLAR